MKILIAHNSQSRAKRYQNALEKRGHVVFGALPGSNCLKIYSDFQQPPRLAITEFQFVQCFDCVILVYDRRLFDGLELARKIWDLNPYQRIVFTLLHKDAVGKYPNSEFDLPAEYIIEPFSMKKLIEVVEEKQIYTYLEKLDVDTDVIRLSELNHHQLLTIVGILEKRNHNYLNTSRESRIRCPNCGCTPFDCTQSPTPGECDNCRLDTCCCWKIIKR